MTRDLAIPLPGGRTLRRGAVPLVMGILNVTPDSFSDGGTHLDRQSAIDAALQMERDGAAVIDVGGESTRPGAPVVPVSEELERVVPVIEAIRARTAVPISVDTRKAAVAEAALDAGADIVNDVSAMAWDGGMLPLVATRGVPVILMHMRGEPATMQQHAVYDDVVADVTRELMERTGAALAGGVGSDRILLDPGIGFAKTIDHNLAILARCAELAAIGPIVIGASRKAFVGHLTGRASGPGRMAGSLGAVAAAQRGGAAMVRVHDVRETVDFLRVVGAIEGGKGGK